MLFPTILAVERLRGRDWSPSPHHHLHVTYVVRAPPITGATIMAIHSRPPTVLLHIGLQRGGTEWVIALQELGIRAQDTPLDQEEGTRRTHMKTPIRIPAEPEPAMALPTMKAGELVAVAHTIDPTSRMTTAAIRTHFTRHCSYILLKRNWLEQVESRSIRRRSQLRVERQLSDDRGGSG